MAKSIIERFEEKIFPEPMSGCWIWMGYERPGGYGQFNRGRRGEGMCLSHRFSYELYKGPIPEGLEKMPNMQQRRAAHKAREGGK